MSMFHRQRKLSIATKVALSFFSIVVLQGTMTQFGMSMLIFDSNESNFHKRLESSLESVDAYVRQSVENLQNKSRLLAGQQNIISYSEFRLINLLNRELSLFDAPLSLDGIFVFSPEGLILGSSFGSGYHEAGLGDQMRAAVLAGRTSLVSTIDGAVYLWSLSPIVSAETVIAFLGARMAIDADFIEEIQEISGVVHVIRYDDRAIYAGNADEQLIEDVLGIAPDSIGSEGLRSGNYLYGAVDVTGLGYGESYLLTLLDMGESRKLVARYNQIAVLMSLMVLAIALVLSIVFYRHSFLQPYKTLIEGVGRIEHGDYSFPLNHTSADEFGDLVQSVDRMRLKLMDRERRLTELANYNQLVFENVRSGIVIVGENREITRWNSAARSMATGSNDISLPVAIGASGLPGNIQQMLAQGVENGEYVNLLECRSDAESGDEIFSLSTSPFTGPGGENLGLIAVISDITQTRNLERQLGISQRLAAIGEMVSGVSHQLRNPLAIMKVSAEMLRDNYECDFQHEQLSTMLVSEIDTLNYVIDNFLDFARPIHSNPTDCDAQQLIQASLTQIPLGQFHHVKLSIDVDPQAKLLNVDRELMEQVISNLLMNALEASVDSPEPRVDISVMPGESSASICIRDNGAGMDEHIKQNIFTPFFTHKANGTGLGLSIVHRIIQEHGGSIEVNSRLGEGSEFIVVV